jgi:hypothetical protein
MDERAIKLFGTEEPVPERRVLRAGPVTATLEAGQLRWIRIGEVEAIRGIAFLIRDRNWSTAVPEISNLQIDENGGGFRVSFDAVCATADGELVWRGEFSGSPDGTIRCEASGRPEADFLTARTGFVILHPLQGVIGQPIRIEHTDGSVEEGVVPEAISPGQPYFHVRAMTHQPTPGVSATIRMEGDTWETEDHRNWTDASLKTYSRPLALPYPYTIKAGEEVRHTATVSFSGDLPKAPAGDPGPVTITLGEPVGTMPRIGLSVLPEDAERAVSAAEIVELAGIEHLNCRLDLRDRAWRAPLAAYRALARHTGAEIVLEVIIPGASAPEAELRPVAAAAAEAGLNPAAVVVTPAAHLKSVQPGTPFPDGTPTFEQLAAAARAAFPGVRIGGGMLANFTELNRTKPPQGLFDFIAHATSGVVHAADDRSVMETIEAVGHIIRSTQSFIGDAAYRIGPSHIGNSFNPYGASHTENPGNGRVTMARVDPRHRALFGAAWHLGYLSQVAEGGLEAATMASPVGEFGIAVTALPHAQPWFDDQPDAKVYPVFHVLRGVAAAAGRERVTAQSSDGERVRALAWRDGETTHLWIANLRDVRVEVRFDGIDGRSGGLWVLDEGNFEAAVADPKAADRQDKLERNQLTLGPYAVARVTARR